MALRTTLPSRESTFPYPLPTDFLAHLEDCVSHTESCSATLSAGLDKLAPGTSDLPRLTKVLGNKHVSGRWQCAGNALALALAVGLCVICVPCVISAGGQ